MQSAGNQYTRKSAVGQNDQPGITATRLAEKYRVSPKTIRRDAKTAAAIEAIGEVSKPAKAMILSGEASLSKTELRELSESPREDIKVIASAIEKGTYEKGGNAQAAVAGTEKPIEGMASAVYSLETSVKALSNSFSLLHEIKSIEDRVKIKTTLRSCIDRLEDLYGQI